MDMDEKDLKNVNGGTGDEYSNLLKKYPHLKNILGGKNLEEYPNKKRKNPITLKYGILEKRNNKKEKE